MNHKTVAKYALSFLGGKPEVAAYYNTDSTRQMDIMTTTGVHEDFCALATIGLNATDVGLRVDGKPLRMELIMAGSEKDAGVLANMLATAAFDIIDSRCCGYGDILPNVVSMYRPDGEMKHLVLLSPVFWEQYQALKTEDETVCWLFAVPISESEKNFVLRQGADAFSRLLEARDADVLDLNRKSVF